MINDANDNEGNYAVSLTPTTTITQYRLSHIPVQETQTLKPTICLSHSGIAAGLQTTISRQPGLEHGPKGTNIAVGYLGKM